MRRKKTNIYDEQKQRYWLAYTQAFLLKDIFPLLAKLVIVMNFKEPDWGRDPQPRHKNYTPDSRAFFEIECPHVECISGGFDLTSAVSNLVDSGEAESSGTIRCQGWQDQERINQHRCLLKMEYKITANYVNRG